MRPIALAATAAIVIATACGPTGSTSPRATDAPGRSSILGRPGELWGAGSAVDKLVVVTEG